MISVVIPVYNVEKYLNKCVSSITEQTYEDLEIILVDDGSTDDSSRLCDVWKQKDKRINVVHKHNGGLSDARNVGIEIASGEYISFIDSDDFISPDYFDYLFALMAGNDADISVCQRYEVDENDNIIKLGRKVSNRVIRGNESCMKVFLTDRSIDTPAWGKLYKRNLFKDSGIRYPVGRLHEDVFTTYKLIHLCSVVVTGSKALYAYRVRSGSIVNSNFSEKHLDTIYGRKELVRFISDNYPSLLRLATPGLIHSANICLIRIGKSGVDVTPYLSLIKPLYKDNIRDYLMSDCRFASKWFAMIAWINIPFLLLVIRKLQ
ncbi:glycosyltransferase family 2 protein [Parabacteroides sp.]